MNKNYVGTYGVIKKNGGIDLICSVNYEGGGLFASILKCIDENDEYLKVIIFGNCKEENKKIAIIKKEGYEILKKFKNYYIVKEKNSIGEEIGDIKIEIHSSLVEELKQDILNGGGTLNEINDIKHFIFYDSWNCRVIFEILAEITEYV